MKRVLFILSFVVTMVLTYAAFFSGIADTPVKPERKTCTGYEVIEAGKGIDCHGDTIKLTKRSGFYEVAANYPVE
jgi:hypothetical protein